MLRLSVWISGNVTDKIYLEWPFWKMLPMNLFRIIFNVKKCLFILHTFLGDKNMLFKVLDVSTPNTVWSRSKHTWTKEGLSVVPGAACTSEYRCAFIRDQWQGKRVEDWDRGGMFQPWSDLHDLGSNKHHGALQIPAEQRRRNTPTHQKNNQRARGREAVWEKV